MKIKDLKKGQSAYASPSALALDGKKEVVNANAECSPDGTPRKPTQQMRIVIEDNGAVVTLPIAHADSIGEATFNNKIEVKKVKTR